MYLILLSLCPTYAIRLTKELENAVSTRESTNRAGTQILGVLMLILVLIMLAVNLICKETEPTESEHAEIFTSENKEISTDTDYITIIN